MYCPGQKKTDFEHNLAAVWGEIVSFVRPGGITQQKMSEINTTRYVSDNERITLKSMSCLKM